MARGDTRGWAGRLAADERGAAMVEFLLTAPAFFMLLIGIVQVGILGMVSADFNAALSGASRQIRTGQADGPTSAAEFKQRICARMTDDTASCMSRLAVDVRAMGRFSEAAGVVGSDGHDDLTSDGGFNPGGPQQVVVVTATYKWPMAVPFAEGAFERVDGVNVQIVGRVAFQNEPYR
jgi:Flp pilus assembly protein TadG